MTFAAPASYGLNFGDGFTKVLGVIPASAPYRVRFYSDLFAGWVEARF